MKRLNVIGCVFLMLLGVVVVVLSSGFVSGAVCNPNGIIETGEICDPNDAVPENAAACNADCTLKESYYVNGLDYWETGGSTDECMGSIVRLSGNEYRINQPSCNKQSLFSLTNFEPQIGDFNLKLPFSSIAITSEPDNSKEWRVTNVIAFRIRGVHENGKEQIATLYVRKKGLAVENKLTVRAEYVTDVEAHSAASGAEAAKLVEAKEKDFNKNKNGEFDIIRKGGVFTLKYNDENLLKYSDGFTKDARVSIFTSHGQTPNERTSNKVENVFGPASKARFVYNIGAPLFKKAVCGNGEIESRDMGGEECDDENTVGGDGCSADCKNEVPEPVDHKISAAYWTDMADDTITESCLGDSVRLVAKNNFDSGIIDFEIFKSANMIKNGLSVDTDGIEAVTQWKVEGVSEEDELTFKATLGDNEKESEILTIKNSAECFNSEPVAIIARPEHRGMYFVNTELSFESDSFDVESGIVKHEWIIEEQDKNVITKNEKDFEYNFNTPGQKTITLRVEDSEGLSDEVQIAILVLGDEGMLTFIETPEHKEYIIDNDLYIKGKSSVDFSAEESYVVESSEVSVSAGVCTGTVKCSAGNCPSETKNSPVSCTGVIDVIDSPQSFSDLLFTWAFDGGESLSGLGNSNGKKVYSTSGTKKINLILKSNSLNIENFFTREFILAVQCRNGGLSFHGIDPITGEIKKDGVSTLSDNEAACSGPDGGAGNADDCCPIGFICTSNGCVLPPKIIENLCERYSTSEECNDDLYGAASAVNYPVLWTETPSCAEDRVNCFCAWDENELDDTKKCKLEKDVRENSIVFPPSVEPNLIDECLFDYATSECIDGVYDISWTVSCTSGDCVRGGSECKPGNSGAIPCGGSKIELPFFGMTNLILTIIGIFIAYFFLIRYKGHRL